MERKRREDKIMFDRFGLIREEAMQENKELRLSSVRKVGKN